MKLKAFLNSEQTQTKFVQRLEKHYTQDEIIKGRYWENGKGCAVGCTVHSNSHSCYEIELGIPEWVARLEDILFEGMPNKHAKEFPLKFIKSIPLGFENWQHIYHQLCVFMLEKICKNIDNKIVVKAIYNIITLHKIESKNEAIWASTARSAARSADSAARSADSAAWSAADSAARSADSAAWSAAARSADSAAWSAARFVAARSAAYKSTGDKLIELLENEK